MKKIYLLTKFFSTCLSGLRYYTIIIILSFFSLSCSTQNNKQVETKEVDDSNSSWSIEGFGGGGAMFYPAVSPHDPEFAVVACDMTGSYVTYNGGSTWKMFSLRGPVKYFVFDPVDSNVVYAKSIALFKSSDRCKTWNLIYPDSDEINGVVAKGDHGYETIVTNDSTTREVLAMAVDPDNSMKLYAAIKINNSTGLYQSENQGKNWTKERDLENGVMNIFVVPSTPIGNRTLYITSNKSVTVREKGLWKINTGPKNIESFNEFTGGFDYSLKKYIIYAISGKSYFNPKGGYSGIYYSDNGGETWQNRQDALIKLRAEKTDMPEWRTIATSSMNPKTIYVSYAGLKIHNDTTCIGVAKSEDFGITWELPWKDRITVSGGIYSKNYNGGWIDERFAPTWGENPFSIAVSPRNPDICYTSDFGRTIRTIDGGKSWEQVYTNKKEGAGWISRGLDVSCSYGVVFDPFNIDHLFILNTDIGLMESRDGGLSWSSATHNNGVPKIWINSTYCLAFDPNVEGKAWAAMSNVHDLPRPKMWKRSKPSTWEGGLLETRDAGKTWMPVSMDIGEAAITHILIDTLSNKESRTLYACAFGKGVYKSVDGGKSWLQKNIGIEGIEPFAWKISLNAKNGDLFLIKHRKTDDGSIGNPGDGAIYLSHDGAESWKKMSLPEGTNGPTGLLIDPEYVDRIIISAWGRITKGQFSQDIGGGIFLSKDNGITWIQVLSKDQNIHDITFDSRNHTYYACGFNGSAYRSENHGESWERIKGYNFKWGRRVDPDPRDAERVFISTFGGGIWFGPARGDINAKESIVTQKMTN